jgi:hypothetical protein
MTGSGLGPGGRPRRASASGCRAYEVRRVSGSDAAAAHMRREKAAMFNLVAVTCSAQP